MKPQPDTTTASQYRVPAIRHLAWMCRAPQLIGPPARFDLSEYLPDNLEERLSDWDAAPEMGPALLMETPPRRLGHYFENLYECLLRDLLGWEILLRNQPVRSNGITLGELDFIVRNPRDRMVEHHEIAVKFYLGYPDPDQTEQLWYGPNSKDRLDLKTARLLSHQSRLTEKPETRALLHSLGIVPPARARIFMPGYLFYPAHQQLHLPGEASLPNPGEASLPNKVPPDHLRGEWLWINELDRMNNERKTTSLVQDHWIPLIKPHWLGPWHQHEPPDKHLTADALETVRSSGSPRLFAVLAQTDEDNVWQEDHRVFVVPASWP